MSTTSHAEVALTKEQREKLAGLLRSKRDEIRQRRLRGPDDRTLEVEADPLDTASELTSEADAAGVALQDAGILREIDDALERMARGTYGVSEETGEPIAYPRLLAIPWARRTVEEEEEAT